MTYIPQPQLGRGATLSWTANATTPTTIAFLPLVSVTPPALTVGEVENLLLASLFGPYLPTIPEAEGSFKVQHWEGDPGCAAMFAACSVAPVPLGVFLITLSNGSTISIPGFPKKYAISEVQNKEIITADVDYRQTGPLTYTPSSTIGSL